jgi:Domain of unknown function DUF11/RTX calcium-binding nonapeptide repeat (4 copies)/WD40-like Beta Propeller Repeat
VKRFLGLCLVVVLAALVARAGSAAAPASNARIVLLEGGDLYSVAPDGSDRRRLTLDGRVVSPVGSPNGERIAFLKSDGSSPRDLYVMNADGTGGARLIASHSAETNVDGILALTWSPDSSRLAYYLPFANPAIRIVDARDGTPVRLRQEGDPRPFAKLEWSPDGTELLYDAGGDIWTKPLDGRPARLVVALTGQETRATWAPDGTRIAFIHAGTQAGGGIYVARRDGSELRHVAATGTAQIGTVRWKPDATAVVFDATVVEGVGPRNIPLTTTRILYAGAEGASIGVLRDHVADPTPSPDNAQILIGRALRTFPPGYEAIKPGVYTMNADGSCLTFVTTGTAVGWLPGPPAALASRRECVDLVVSATAPSVTGLRGAQYIVYVRNDGTRPATNVRLELRLDADVRFLVAGAARTICSESGAVLTCRIGRVDRGATTGVAVLARPAAAVPLTARIAVSSDVRDSDPQSDEISVRTRVFPCWIAGTDFNDELRGTNAAEELCGRAGDDVVAALGGADRVYGGWGRDRLIGGSGSDLLVGGRGDDTFLARDAYRDVIDCGWGRDLVFVDRRDRVLRGCEVVRRS